MTPETPSAFERVLPRFRRIHAKVWTSGAEDLLSLDEIERAIYVTWVLEGDVDNGGWEQAFGNSTDAMIEPAIAGYELMGLADYVAVLRRVKAELFSDHWNEAAATQLN